MADEEVVLYEREGRLAYLTLNRPERLNAFNVELWAQLVGGMKRAGDDDEVRVVIIRGAGRCFSAGGDVSDGGMTIGTPLDHRGDVVEDARRLHETTDRYLWVFNFPKPVIAQVHGYCLGVASQLAVMCDLTVVADDAVMGVPTIPLGGGYISPMWSWLVGPKRAKEMSFTVGNRIDGKTASDWGWANRAVPAAELQDTVREMARRIANLPSKSLYLKKMAVNRQLEIQGFATAIRAGGELNAMLHYTDDTETVRASIRQHGLRETIRAFEAGELL